MRVSSYYFFFFFNDTATTEIYTLSLHDALPISAGDSRLRRAVRSASGGGASARPPPFRNHPRDGAERPRRDRKSTRLNSSHANISYAVFCLKKKKKNRKSRAVNTTSDNDQLLRT